MSGVEPLNISCLATYANIAMGKNVTCRNMHSKSSIPRTMQAHSRINSFQYGASKDRFFGQFRYQVRIEGVKHEEIVHMVTSWKCCDCLALCFGFNMYTTETYLYQAHTCFLVLHTG